MASTRRRRPAALSSADSELPLREILDDAPDASIVTDAAGAILLWNRQAEVTFGWRAQEVLGRPLMEVILPAQRDGERAGGKVRIAALASGSGDRVYRRVELPARDRAGREFPIELAVTPIRRAKRQWFVAVARDISARLHGEDLLRFQASILHNLPDSVIAADLSGRVEYWNAGAEVIFGYGADDMLGRTLDVVYPDLLQVPEGEERGGERLGRRRDGSMVWVEVRTTVLRDAGGRGIGVLNVATDITKRKHAEQLRDGSHQSLRDLTGRLQRAREQERTMMARRIHDELGQVLTALAMDVAWIASRLEGRPTALADKCRAMAAQIEQTIGRVRMLATELRPAVLDDLGLVAAIEWEVQQFTQRTGVKGQLELSAPPRALDSERATDVFRILQEALTNVARHAGAREITVRLWTGTRGLELEVQDDGQGIAPDAADDRRSLGLLGMRERALRWGGDIEVGPQDAGGTCVRLHLPLGTRALAEAG